MRLILLGAPGAGKGTQAVMLADKLKVPHISTGDIFRHNMMNNTPLGVKAKEYIDKGMLVPDEVTIDIVKDRIRQEDCREGFILDGFPRTIPQAEYLDQALKDVDVELDAILNICVADKEIIQRLSGRRVCPSCGMSYHMQYFPPSEGGLCTGCNTPVIQREDDKEETVLSRLLTYHRKTEPLIEYYRKQGKLVTAGGKDKIEDTSSEVLKALGVK
jgi:adenylate kinase